MGLFINLRYLKNGPVATNGNFIWFSIRTYFAVGALTGLSSHPLRAVLIIIFINNKNIFHLVNILPSIKYNLLTICQ